VQIDDHDDSGLNRNAEEGNVAHPNRNAEVIAGPFENDILASAPSGNSAPVGVTITTRASF
jgi:hypothetical protein